MKRIALLIVLGCGIASLAGCDEVKRRVTEGARGEVQRNIDRAEQKARDKAREGADAAVDKAAGDDAASVEKRNKLKGGDDDK